MRCAVKGCKNELPEKPKGVINVIDPETFKTSRHAVCDRCYKRITESAKPNPVSISSRSET